MCSPALRKRCMFLADLGEQEEIGMLYEPTASFTFVRSTL